MKFKNKEMKDALKIIKRLGKESSKRENLLIEAKGDTRLYLKGVSDDGNCITYHTIASLDEAVYAFSMNPYELDKYLTELENQLKKDVKDFKAQAEKNGMEKAVIKEEEKALRELRDQVELRINGNTLHATEGKTKFHITPIEEDLHFYFEALTEAKNPERFLTVLKEAELALKKNKDPNTSYLKISSEKALAAEEKQIHFFRMEEDLPFKGAYLHKDVVSILTKSLKGTFQMGLYNEWFVLANQDVYYLVKTEDNIQFPTFRNMKPMHRDIVFTVNIDAVNELMIQYKKTKEKSTQATEIMLTQQGDNLVFDPRNEEYPILEIPIHGVEGQFKRAIFENEVLRTFFAAYQGEVQIEQQQFKNVYGVVGYMWRIYTPEKLTMISGIEEPDWEAIETHFKAGTIKELVRKQ